MASLWTCMMMAFHVLMGTFFKDLKDADNSKVAAIMWNCWESCKAVMSQLHCHLSTGVWCSPVLQEEAELLLLLLKCHYWGSSAFSSGTFTVCSILDQWKKFKENTWVKDQYIELLGSDKPHMTKFAGVTTQDEKLPCDQRAGGWRVGMVVEEKSETLISSSLSNPIGPNILHSPFRNWFLFHI